MQQPQRLQAMEPLHFHLVHQQLLLSQLSQVAVAVVTETHQVAVVVLDQ
jgi:hypothetical protein